MKTKCFAVVLAALLLNSTTMFARQGEKTDPYTALGHAPYIIGADRENELKNAIFVIENIAEGTTLAHNPRTGKAKLFDSNGNLIGETQLKQGERAWGVRDPKSEKYYNRSPYAYCANNPVNRIDPDGMTDYKFDKKTGVMTQVGEINDELDRILKTNRKGEVKYNRKGEAKVEVDDIEKGILSDGINFKENHNIIAVGGEGQASVDGVERFAVELSDMVGKEIAGAYFSKDGAEYTTHISIGSYKNNSYKETKGGYGHSLWNKLYPDSNLRNSLTGFFHTHPSGAGISVSDRTRSSAQDRSSRDSDLRKMPNLQFYILTHPIYPGGKFPYKFSYTNEW